MLPVLGTSITCSSLGIIEQRPDDTAVRASNIGVNYFRMGLLQSLYRACDRGACKAERFLFTCRTQFPTWKRVLQQTDLMVAATMIHDIVSRLAPCNGGSLQALIGDGYVQLSLVRKLTQGCIVHGNMQQCSVQAVEAVKQIGTEERNYLDALPEEWTMEEVSRFVFYRPDWGMFVSMFSCLWEEVVRCSPKDAERLLPYVATLEFQARARTLKTATGHASRPMYLVDIGKKKTPKRYLQRRRSP